MMQSSDYNDVVAGCTRAGRVAAARVVVLGTQPRRPLCPNCSTECFKNVCINTA